jgi:hypothetical protein
MLRFLKRLVFALVTAIVVMTVVIGSVSRTVPEWYQPPSPQNAEVSRLAERVEYRLVEETRKIREPEDLWTLRVREEQINAWLATRLPEWIAHEQGVQWPPQLGTPQVRVDRGHVALALPVGDDAYRRVVVARLGAEVRDGGLWLSLERVQVGRLAIPGDPLDTLLAMARRTPLQDQIDGTAWKPVLDVLSGREPLEPMLELGDNRRVELMDVRCRRGAIEFTSRTHGVHPPGTTAVWNELEVEAEPAAAPTEAPIQ